MSVIFQLLVYPFPASQDHNHTVCCLLSYFARAHWTSIILYLYRYDLILPWPVAIIVNFEVTLIFSFNLSATLGKYSFVVTHFVVRSHSICHFVSLFILMLFKEYLYYLRLTICFPFDFQYILAACVTDTVRLYVFAVSI